MTVTVVAGVIRKDNAILITRRFNDVHLPGLWEFPGGKVESGESLQQALKREILEEVGVLVNVEEEVFAVDHHYPSKSVRLHFFICSILQGEPQIIQVANLRWVFPKDLAQFDFPEADKELVDRLAQS